ncbi:STAS domain-containing protein [Streptomyces sp. NPDC050548]|uniref:STAS domain-containing protein n=1 Tax=Streptomyces sp. NPDC050548 TaxID=3365629 RepID=UPI0037ABA35F
MPLPQLTVQRHDLSTRALITLAGEIDHESAPLVRVSLERRLRDGVRAIDVDLASVTFCDCSGLNTFLRAAQRSTALGGTLRLHRPPTVLLRILAVTGCGSLLLGSPPGNRHLLLKRSPPRPYRPRRAAWSGWCPPFQDVCDDRQAQAGQSREPGDAASRATSVNSLCPTATSYGDFVRRLRMR